MPTDTIIELTIKRQDCGLIERGRLSNCYSGAHCALSIIVFGLLEEVEEKKCIGYLGSYYQIQILCIASLSQVNS
jgi:hypothetical protein